MKSRFAVLPALFVSVCASSYALTPTPAPSATPAPAPKLLVTPKPVATPLTPNVSATPPGTDYPDLRKNLEKLTLENAVADQQLKQDLADVNAQRMKLDAETGLKSQQTQASLTALQDQIAQIDKKTELMRSQLEQKDMDRRTKLDPELADLRAQLAKQQAANDLAAAQMASKLATLQQRSQEIDVEQKELMLDRSKLESGLAKLNAEIDLRDKRDTWKNRVNREIDYTKEPFKDGVLTISDRKIALDGIITDDTATYISERIDYFNNQSADYPIFIVITSSPGGSVMAGYKILKAMQGSPAPVYVVVKSFAASMAAGITTQAVKSFAYPNAIILHHQIIAGSIGNLTEQRETVKELDEWWRRLEQPVAAKMGISLDEFIKQMYEHRSTGDWMEFADHAQKIKWVDQIVNTIRDESYDKNPDTQPNATAALPPTLQEKADPNGHRYMLLPRLSPLDCYYLYNPDGYYRMEN
ncbi:MAG: ATP-dependent Clp protease proteolytic subunit [Chthoniobacteraceae bacterium]